MVDRSLASGTVRANELDAKQQPAGDSDEEFAALASRAYVRLSRAACAVGARVNSDLSEVGLTVSQFAVLEVLYNRGPLCQKEIAQRILAQSSGNMTVVVDHLEERGLVVRRPSATDRRQVLVHLTERGRALLEDFRPRHVARIVEEMSVLDPSELRLLSDLCRRLGLKERRQEPPAQ